MRVRTKSGLFGLHDVVLVAVLAVPQLVWLAVVAYLLYLRP